MAACSRLPKSGGEAATSATSKHQLPYALGGGGGGLIKATYAMYATTGGASETERYGAKARK